MVEAAVKIKVDTSEIDEAIEKVDLLNEKLEKAVQLSKSLSEN